MRCSRASKVAGCWVVLAALGALAGCRVPDAGHGTANSQVGAAFQHSAFPLTVVDDAGRRITFLRPPSRIVSLAPSNTEILYALGLGNRVVAVDRLSDFPPDAARKPHIGGYLTPSREQVIAAAPDLLLAVGYHLDQAVPQFEIAHINTLVLDPHDLEGMLRDLVLIGLATGQNAQAAKLAGTLRSRIAAVTARVRGATRPTVYYELDKQLYTAGPGSFLHDLIVLAGGDNIAADTGKPWPKISAELLLLRNVDMIFLGDMTAGVTPESVSRRPGWRNLRAVQNRRIVGISPDLACRPGPRVVDALETIAHALHPERY